MKKATDKLEQYLHQANLPVETNETHQQVLRHQVLTMLERRQTMSVPNRIHKLVWIILAVIAGGAMATAVGVKIYRFHFSGQDEKGTYVFTTEPEVVHQSPPDANGNSTETTTTSRTISMGYHPPEGVTDATEAEKVEQMQQDLEEIDQLRERDERELWGVTDQWINGHFHRTCHYRYTLADGRQINMGEGDPVGQRPRTPEQFQKDREEIETLRAQDQRQLVRIVEEDVEGDIFRGCMYEYTLGDGYAKTIGESDPDPSVQTPVLSETQQKEVWRLRSLKQGEFLGYLDYEIHGLVFSCETYVFTLPDGTVVTHAVGERKDRKTSLTEADWEEFRGLLSQDACELLDITERDVHGKRFRFERKRYYLQDGTEIIRAHGTPAE